MKIYYALVLVLFRPGLSKQNITIVIRKWSVSVLVHCQSCATLIIDIVPVCMPSFRLS